MEQEQNNLYTAEDIARYHSGVLSPQEMHRIERAALDDPFLADALEGYVHTQQPLQDVADLRQRLNRRTRRKVVALPARPAVFLRVAALVILLAGMGWIAFRYNFGAEGLARNPEGAPQQQPAATQAEPLIADSASVGLMDAAPAGDQVPEEVKKNPGTASARPATQEPITATAGNQVAQKATAETATESEADLADAKARRAAAAPARMETDARNRAAAPQHVISGQVVDANNTAIPNAQLNVPEYKLSVRTDANGNFSVPANDTSVVVSVQSQGFEQNQAVVRNNAANRIVLQPAESKMEEVVISGSGSKKKESSPRINLEGAEPLNGNRSYQQYVVEQLKPFEARTAGVQGSVELVFDIDESGKPINVKVEKSSCTPCDQEAIRVIREGPRLKKTKKNRQPRARIFF